MAITPSGRPLAPTGNLYKGDGSKACEDNQASKTTITKIMYPRRFRQNHTHIDWPRLIKRIVAQGWSIQDIADAIGHKNIRRLGGIARETCTTNQSWDEAFALIELYFKVTDTGQGAPTLPRLFYDDRETETKEGKITSNLSASDWWPNQMPH